MRWTSLFLLALLAPQAWGACEQNPDGTWPTTCAALSWEAPIQNVDGTPLTDLAGYRIYRDCGSGQSMVADVAAPTQAWADETPPIPATCEYRATAYNALNEESAQTNPVSKSFAPDTEPPGAVTATFTWQVEEIIAPSVMPPATSLTDGSGNVWTMTIPASGFRPLFCNGNRVGETGDARIDAQGRLIAHDFHETYQGSWYIVACGGSWTQTTPQ